jgi:hypothetical protein
MAWQKPTPEMIKCFDDMLPKDPAVERRVMFGCPTGFANGNLFLGLHENRFILRLSEEDRASFIRDFAAKAFEPMPGRVSRDTLVVPETLGGQTELLRDWCERAFRHALTLPPKKAMAKPLRKPAAASAKRRSPR